MLYGIIIFVAGFVIGFCVAGLVFSDKYIVNELAIIKFMLEGIFDWIKGISNKIDLLCIKNGIFGELTDEEREQIEILENLKRLERTHERSEEIKRLQEIQSEREEKAKREKEEKDAENNKNH